jgi:hypothetical protein
MTGEITLTRILLLLGLVLMLSLAATRAAGSGLPTGAAITRAPRTA